MNKGKKIETWKFEKNRSEILVPVHLITPESHEKRKRLYFRCDLEEFDIHETSENLTTLKTKVFGALDRKTDLDWKPYLQLTVDGESEMFSEKPKTRNASISVSLAVSVQPILLTKTKTGEKLHKDHPEGVPGRSQYQQSRSEYVQSGWPETKKRHLVYGRTPTVVALVPDTPENRAALNLLSTDVGKLLERLLELFAPNAAEKTLANAVGVRWLTEGERNE